MTRPPWMEPRSFTADTQTVSKWDFWLRDVIVRVESKTFGRPTGVPVARVKVPWHALGAIKVVAPWMEEIVSCMLGQRGVYIELKVVPLGGHSWKITMGQADTFGQEVVLRPRVEDSPKRPFKWKVSAIYPKAVKGSAHPFCQALKG